jgi:hypothetical protein
MLNHVHLIVVPNKKENLRSAIGRWDYCHENPAEKPKKRVNHPAPGIVRRNSLNPLQSPTLCFEDGSKPLRGKRFVQCESKVAQFT